MKYIDLTQEFKLPMPVWLGDPEPYITQTASIESDGFRDEEITSGLHVGTHIDAPAHMIRNGRMISDYPIDRFMSRGTLVDARGKKLIDASLLRNIDLQPGDIVVVLTGWSKYYRTSSIILSEAMDSIDSSPPKADQNDNTSKYFDSFPEVTESFAEKLIESQVSMLALDTPSPDNEPFEIHRLLLENDILIAENLNNVEQLANVKSFEVLASPLNLPFNASPARIIARIETRK